MNVVSPYQAAFIQRQLDEFYIPMVSMANDIGVRIKLKVKLDKSVDEVWADMCSRRPFPDIDESEDAKRFRHQFDLQIEADNTEFTEFIIPQYNRMRELFAVKYSITEEATQQYYENFCHYVGLWNKHINNEAPSLAIRRVMLNESDLSPFYDDLEAQLKTLKAKLKGA